MTKLVPLLLAATAAVSCKSPPALPTENAPAASSAAGDFYFLRIGGEIPGEATDAGTLKPKELRAAPAPTVKAPH